MRVDHLVALTRLMFRRRPAPLRRLEGARFGASFAPATVPSAPRDRSELERRFDEHTTGPGIWKWRHYFEIYDRYLARFVGRTVDVVEVGVFSGGSLAMWRDYFGCGATIHGVDIDPACISHEGEQIRIHIGDQADPEFWRRFVADVPAIDVVIDDGGHEAYQQIATLEALLPRLRPGGIYLCEDIHGRSHDFHAYVDGLSRHLHAFRHRDAFVAQRPSALQRSVEAVHLHPYVAVIEMRKAAMDELFAPRHGTEWRPTASLPGGATRGPGATA